MLCITMKIKVFLQFSITLTVVGLEAVFIFCETQCNFTHTATPFRTYLFLIGTTSGTSPSGGPSRLMTCSSKSQFFWYFSLFFIRLRSETFVPRFYFCKFFSHQTINDSSSELFQSNCRQNFFLVENKRVYYATVDKVKKNRIHHFLLFLSSS